MESRTLLKVAPGEGQLELARRAFTEPPTGQVLIKIRRAAICGTDLHIYHWNDWAARNYTLPLVLGHEFCGEVLAIGAGVEGLRVGQLVSGETHISCGKCEQCRSNRRHICDELRLFSKSGFGCFCDHSLVPPSVLRAVPGWMPLERAAILEPLGIGVRAATEAEVSGKRVLILGCGPIGLYAVAAAKALGAFRIAATDLSTRRIAMALEVGADEAISAPFPSNAFDVAIDATGSATAIEGAFAALRSGGTMIAVGLPDRPIAVAPVHLISREITLRGLYGRLIDETWLATERLLASGRLALDGIETTSFPLTEFGPAFKLASLGTTGKVIFDLDAE
jgi:threonine 3-dehydrogenase